MFNVKDIVMKLISFLIFVAVIFGCDGSEIKFSEPQPSRVNSKDRIPSYLEGYYELISDTSIVGDFDKIYPLKEKEKELKLNVENKIKITSRGFFNYLQGDVELELKKSDSEIKTYDLKKAMFDTLVNNYYKRANYTYNVVALTDSSITYKFNLIDTMFYISPKNILKMFKGVPYLNINYAPKNWTVFQIKSNKDGSLYFKSTSKADENVLRRIMSINNEVLTKDSLAPSKKSFLKFIKMEGFENAIKLKRKVK